MMMWSVVQIVIYSRPTYLKGYRLSLHNQLVRSSSTWIFSNLQYACSFLLQMELYRYLGFFIKRSFFSSLTSSDVTYDIGNDYLILSVWAFHNDLQWTVLLMDYKPYTSRQQVISEDKNWVFMVNKGFPFIYLMKGMNVPCFEKITTIVFPELYMLDPLSRRINLGIQMRL